MNNTVLSNLQVEWLINKLGETKGKEKINLLRMYQEKWELCEIELKQELSINSLIFYATTKKYGKVIFKILLNDGFDKEISALRLFQGDKFCSLYEYSLEDQVYMMERITPGSTLFEGTTRRERVKIVAEVYKGLHHSAPEDSPFPTYLEWLEMGEVGTRERKDCASLRHYLEKAKEMVRQINKKYARKLLLHGDLHHENVLKNETGNYTVIDPKGVIGDPVFDLSRFILDEFKDDLSAESPSVILDFVKALGSSVGIPYEILLQCLYAETVIWLFREELAGGEPLEECEGLIENMKIAYRLVKDNTLQVSVSMFREDDPKGVAPRALYRKFGFVEDERIEEFGYPNQRFILRGLL